MIPPARPRLVRDRCASVRTNNRGLRNGTTCGACPSRFEWTRWQSNGVLGGTFDYFGGDLGYGGSDLVFSSSRYEVTVGAGQHNPTSQPQVRAPRAPAEQAPARARAQGDVVAFNYNLPRGV